MSTDAGSWDTHPLTADRFDDFADVVNKNRRTTHCWCTTHRLSPKEIDAYGGREEAMRALAASAQPPGVLTYVDDVPVGWCNIGPRASITRLNSSKLITPVDDTPVWSIVCTIVRTGYRRRGVTRALIDGAVAYAASRGAPAVEVYPVDPPGRMDLTMAFVGVKPMFDAAGFEVVGTTRAVAGGLPRLVMRKVV
ncbi:GNAT family N-acetyltransferase [Gordonia asplenii]|uniref:GNAT family N-acetyltransferase n=1 Tax=Gordonia asplenii TaxID=2725283 RepID=UPI0028AC3B90|nr:GNAT family N-acetyltransferase [Gordonia asplenii]